MSNKFLKKDVCNLSTQTPPNSCCSDSISTPSPTTVFAGSLNLSGLLKGIFFLNSKLTDLLVSNNWLYEERVTTINRTHDELRELKAFAQANKKFVDNYNAADPFSHFKYSRPQIGQNNRAFSFERSKQMFATGNCCTGTNPNFICSSFANNEDLSSNNRTHEHFKTEKYSIAESVRYSPLNSNKINSNSQNSPKDNVNGANVTSDSMRLQQSHKDNSDQNNTTQISKNDKNDLVQIDKSC
ncbi:hypothetical protein RFI_09891 [Reticulomyxa filosa]|uniref:Uncharacterized protein n=1 Tax=Reticulomyxa filosa TaxID=46433 RepID=X6NPE0_RETFI|nr:hypothetical protein RFI_09891 [Reticulomyxa filosa]|eukprot:ETO27242.1 hypothetical protein RFI_09891 [Reticulomyxa filosa]